VITIIGTGKLSLCMACCPGIQEDEKKRTCILRSLILYSILENLYLRYLLPSVTVLKAADCSCRLGNVNAGVELCNGVALENHMVAEAYQILHHGDNCGMLVFVRPQ